MIQSTNHKSSRFSATDAELRIEFILMDRDRDGLVNYREFTEMMKGLEAQMSEEDMRIGFHAVDTDHDGFIGRDEFIEWWMAD